MFIFNWWKSKGAQGTRLVVRADVQVKVISGIEESRLVPISRDEIKELLATAEAGCLSGLLISSRKSELRWSFGLQMTTHVVDSKVEVTLTLCATPKQEGMLLGDAETSLTSAVAEVIKALDCPVYDRDIRCRLTNNDGSEQGIRLYPPGTHSVGGLA